MRVYVCVCVYACVRAYLPPFTFTIILILFHIIFSAVPSTSSTTSVASTSGLPVGRRMCVYSDSESDADLPDTLPYSGNDK